MTGPRNHRNGRNQTGPAIRALTPVPAGALMMALLALSVGCGDGSKPAEGGAGGPGVKVAAGDQAAPLANRELDAALKRGRELRQKGQLDPAEEAYRRALELAQKDGDRLSTADAQYNIGRILGWKGQIAQSGQMIQTALDQYLALGLKSQAGECYTTLAAGYWTMADFATTEKMLRAAIDIYLEMNDQAALATLYAQLGLLKFDRGDGPEVAEELMLKALEVSEQLGDEEAIAGICVNLAGVYAATSNLEGCEAMTLRALEIHKKMEGHPNAARLLAGDYSNLGMVNLDKGNLEEAEKYLRMGLTLDERTDDRGAMANTYANLGTIEFRRKNNAGARENWTLARDLARQAGSADVEAQMTALIEALDEAEAASDPAAPAADAAPAPAGE